MRMKISEALRSRFTAGLLIGGLVTYALGVLSTDAYYLRKQSKNHSPLLTVGFDFNLFRSSEVEWRGPNIGEKIDLSGLRSQDGRPLAEAVGKRPLMIVAVNPACGMCKIADDEMSHIRAKLATMGIDYYIVSFAPINPQSDFFAYAA